MSHPPIETLLKWGKEKIVPTVRGDRMVRQAKETPEFAEVWRLHKEELYAAGVTRQKPPGSPHVIVKWWKFIPTEIAVARRTSLEASHAGDADIVVPVPDGLAYLGYQKAGIAFAKGREGTLIADEMGLGKTVQTCGIINDNAAIHRSLIICPAHLKIKWFKELKKWLVRPLSVGIADGQCFPTTDIVIVNFQILPKWPNKLTFYWDLVCVDEIHELRNGKAIRTKLVFGYRPTPKEKKKGVQPVMSIPARRRLGLTGTPVANAPIEMFGIIHWLDPKNWKSKTDFATRYCAYNYHNKTGMKGSSHEEELQRLLRSTVMIRRLKRDVLKELPAKRREVIELPASKVLSVQAENSALKPFLESMAKMKASVELARVAMDLEKYQKAVDEFRTGMKIAFDQIAVIRRETAVAKIPLVIEHVTPLIEEGHKIILFAYHREVVIQLHKAFPKSVMIIGGMGGPEKMRSVDTFQNNEDCPLIVGNLDAMGTGLDLVAADLVLFAEEDWLPLKISQAEDRAHRIGQTNSILIQHLVLEGSIDARMAYRTIAKQEIADKCLDRAEAEGMVKEPLIPMPEGVTVSLKEIKREAGSITDGELIEINRLLQILMGESAQMKLVDREILRALAGFLSLTRPQGVLARRLVREYRAHLPEASVQRVLGTVIQSTDPDEVKTTVTPVRIAPVQPIVRTEPVKQPIIEGVAGQLALF